MYRQGLMAGDYYGRRSGYQGDIFGSIFKAIGGGIKGFITGGPLGAITGAASTFLPRTTAAAVQNPIGATLPPVLRLSLPSSASTPLTRSGIDSVKVSGGYAGPLGIGAGTTTIYPHVGGGPAKKRRRMNVTNVKALRRAGRRVVGFEKLAKRFIGFASPRKPKGRVYFRRARKRS